MALVGKNLNFKFNFEGFPGYSLFPNILFAFSLLSGCLNYFECFITKARINYVFFEILLVCFGFESKKILNSGYSFILIYYPLYHSFEFLWRSFVSTVLQFRIFQGLDSFTFPLVFSFRCDFKFNKLIFYYFILSNFYYLYYHLQ